MGIADFFKKINDKMQGSFDKIVDFLSNKGIPASKYVDFLESKGIPAMWFTLSLIVLLSLIVFFIVHTFLAPTSKMTVAFKTDDGTLISTAFLNISDSSGNSLFSGSVNAGDVLTLKGFGPGDVIYISASVDGFSYKGPMQYSISDSEFSLTLNFSAIQNNVNVYFRFVDDDTSTVINDVSMKVYDGSKLIAEAKSDTYGKIDMSLPEKDLKIKLVRDGYEDLEKDITVLEDKEFIIRMKAKSFSSGEEGSFKFIVKDAFDNFLSNVKINIYDIKSNKKLGSVTTDDSGVALFKAAKGTAIRFVATKDGFKDFDSNIENLSRTLVKDLEVIEVNMGAGGDVIDLSAVDDKGVPISDVYVAVFSENKLLIKDFKTDISGTVLISGTDLSFAKYISLYKQGYYPKSIEIDSTVYKVTLEKTINTKNAFVDIFTSNNGKAVANAELSFFYKDNNEYLPFALPNSITNPAGYYALLLKEGSSLKVEARTDSLFGEAEALSLKAGKNRLDVFMNEAESSFNLYLYDDKGNPLSNADISLYDKEGNEVFSGKTDDKGHINFKDGLKYKELGLVVDKGGKTYSITIHPKDNLQIKVNDVKANKLSIKFLGIETLDGEKVDALQKGKTYILKFSVFWATADKGGVHIRVGKDSQTYGPSQDIGIVGYDAMADSYHYGLSYNPNPLPGSYSSDYYSGGEAGLFNKWLELYFNSPAGVSNIAVRVKVKKNTDANKFELHYRAWIEKDSTFVRDPDDSIYNGSKDSQQKYSLYANTYFAELNVHKAAPGCSKNICLSASFVDKTLYNYGSSLTATVDTEYALDFEISSKEDAKGSIIIETDKKSPKLYFYSLSSQDVFDFKEQNKSTSRTIQFSSSKNNNFKRRIYFKTEKKGNTEITLRILSSKGSVEKKLNIEITDRRYIKYKVAKTELSLGDPLEIELEDANTHKKLERARITIKDYRNKKIILYKEGDASENLGKDGKYVIEDLKSGHYIAEIEALNYLPVSFDFFVADFKALYVKSSVDLLISKHTKKGFVDIPVINKSNFDLSNLSVSIESANISDDFIITPRPIANIKAGSQAILKVDGFYNGNKDMDSGIVTLRISGMTKDNTLISARTKLHVYYNKLIKDTSCLSVSKKAFVYDAPLIPNFKREESILLSNNCSYDLSVSSSLSENDSGFNLAPAKVVLKKGEEKSVKLVLTNPRPSLAKKEYNLTIYLETEYFTKELPVKITFWDASASMQIITQGQVFVNAFDEKSTQVFPIYVQNLGRMPIENIILYVLDDSLSLSQGGPISTNVPFSPDFYSDPRYRFRYSSTDLIAGLNLSRTSRKGISFLPNRFRALDPGQTVLSRLLVKIATSSKTSQNYYVIVAKGNLANTNTPVIARASIQINMSPKKCVQIKGSSKLSFLARKEGKEVMKKFTVVNNCAEAVAIEGISDNSAFGNPITLKAENGNIIPKNSEKDFVLAVTFNKEASSNKSFFLQGRLVTSGTAFSLPMPLSIRFGKNAVAEGDVSSDTAQDAHRIIDPRTGKANYYVMPKVSNDACNEAYCDAESLMSYINTKISAYINDYYKKFSETKGKVENTSCNDEESCSFEELGLEPMSFAVFFSNDKLSDQLANSNKVKNIKIVQFVDDVDIKDISRQFTNRLLIQNKIDSCGKYILELKGAVQVVNGNIQKDNFNIYLKVSDKENVSACEILVKNAILYLPKDPKTGPDNKFGIRPGYIEVNDASLNEFANSLSRALFTLERISNGKPNTLLIKKGETSYNGSPYLMKLTIHKEKRGVVIEMILNKNYDYKNAKVIKDTVDAFISYTEGNFKGIITEDDVAYIASGKSDAGKTVSGDISITMCDKIPLVKSKWACTISVKSAVVNSVDLKISNEIGEDIASFVFDNGSIEKNISLERKDNFYVADVNVFIDIKDASKLESQIKAGNKISVSASLGDVSSKKAYFSFNTDFGITSIDLLKKSLQSLKENPNNKIVAVVKDNKNFCDSLREAYNAVPDLKVKVSGKEHLATLEAVGSNCNIVGKSAAIHYVEVLENPKTFFAAAGFGSLSCLAVEAGTSKLLIGVFGMGQAIFDCAMQTVFVGMEHYAKVADKKKSLNMPINFLEESALKANNAIEYATDSVIGFFKTVGGFAANLFSSEEDSDLEILQNIEASDYTAETAGAGLAIAQAAKAAKEAGPKEIKDGSAVKKGISKVGSAVGKAVTAAGNKTKAAVKAGVSKVKDIFSNPKQDLVLVKEMPKNIEESEAYKFLWTKKKRFIKDVLESKPRTYFEYEEIENAFNLLYKNKKFNFNWEKLLVDNSLSEESLVRAFRIIGRHNDLINLIGSQNDFVELVKFSEKYGASSLELATKVSGVGNISEFLSKADNFALKLLEEKSILSGLSKKEAKYLLDSIRSDPELVADLLKKDSISFSKSMQTIKVFLKKGFWINRKRLQNAIEIFNNYGEEGLLKVIKNKPDLLVKDSSAEVIEEIEKNLNLKKVTNIINDEIDLIAFERIKRFGTLKEKHWIKFLKEIPEANRRQIFEAIATESVDGVGVVRSLEYLKAIGVKKDILEKITTRSLLRIRDFVAEYGADALEVVYKRGEMLKLIGDEPIENLATRLSLKKVSVDPDAVLSAKDTGKAGSGKKLSKGVKIKEFMKRFGISTAGLIAYTFGYNYKLSKILNDSEKIYTVKASSNQEQFFMNNEYSVNTVLNSNNDEIVLDVINKYIDGATRVDSMKNKYTNLVRLDFTSRYNASLSGSYSGNILSSLGIDFCDKSGNYPMTKSLNKKLSKHNLEYLWNVFLKESKKAKGCARNPYVIASLVYLESGFNPNAKPPANTNSSALGLCQFLRVTGERYGLIRNDVDYRTDPEKNLRACYKLYNKNYESIDNLLSSLGVEHNELCTTILALEAHNQGNNAVIKAINRNVDKFRIMTCNSKEDALKLLYKLNIKGKNPRAEKYINRILSIYEKLVGSKPVNTSPAVDLSNKNILFIGASNTVRIKNSNAFPYAKFCAESGKNIADRIKECSNVIRGKKWDFIVIHIGGNDSGRKFDKVKENLKQLVDLAKQNSNYVILNKLTPRDNRYKEFRTKYNNFITTLDDGTKTFVINPEDVLRYPEDIDDDGVHVRMSSIVRWANLIKNKIQDISEKKITEHKLKILIAGNSVAKKLYAAMKKKYPDLEIDGDKEKCIQPGKNIKRVISSCILTSKYDFIIVHMGINNIGNYRVKGYSINKAKAAFLKDYSDFINKVRNNTKYIIINKIIPQNVNNTCEDCTYNWKAGDQKYWGPLNEALVNAYSNEENIFVFDASNYINPDTDLDSAGIHPNNKATGKWAEALIKYISNIIAESST